MDGDEVAEVLRAVALAQRKVADALDALADSATCRASACCTHEHKLQPEQLLLTAAQAAQRLQMSESHVYRALEEGHLPRVKIGSAVRVRVEDLDDYIDKRRLDAKTINTFAAETRRRNES